MRLLRRSGWAVAVGAILLIAHSAGAAVVQQMNLADLVGNADKVFRGTIVSKEPGTVRAGGSDLPTTVYRIQVEEAIKGDFSAGKDSELLEITMLGTSKAEIRDGRYQRMGRLNLNPDLSIGSDYVLFTTAPSSVGLSTTVGLTQGLFQVFPNAQGREMTANGVNNDGLFDGAVEYRDLVNAVKAELR